MSHQTAFNGGKQLPDSLLPPPLTAMSLLEKIKWAILHWSDAQLLCSARCFCHRLTFCALVDGFRLQSKWLILKTEAFAKVDVIMWRLQIVKCICSNCAALKYFHLPTADLVTPIPCPKTLLSPCAQFFCDRANPTHLQRRPCYLLCAACFCGSKSCKLCPQLLLREFSNSSIIRKYMV